MSQLTMAPALVPSGSAPLAESLRDRIHQRLAPFAEANSAKGYLSFAIDLVLYACGIAAVLLFEHWGAKLVGAMLAGGGLISLGSLSHEAAHRAVVKSKFGNQLISMVTFTLILFNYRLWVYDHHVLHHTSTNVKNHNFLSPLTLEEYRALSPIRRALYRAYHSRTGLGILLYYMIERWPSVHFYPGAWLPQRFRASAWRYTAVVGGYAVALLTLLVTVSTARGESAVLAVLLGFVMPYAFWFWVFSMTAFLQHTNPKLRWYRDPARVDSRPEALSMHVHVPFWLNHMSHYVLEHPVHHVAAAIPHYRLKEAQAALAELVPPSIFTMNFSLGNMSRVLRDCRLYDYDEHVWVDFAGKVTAIPVETAEARRLEAARPFEDLVTGRADAEASPGIFFPADPAAPDGGQAAAPKDEAKL